MNKILLEDIQRIHEIMGVSGKKLIMEGLPPVLDDLLRKSIIGAKSTFNNVYSLVDSVPFSDSTMMKSMKDLYTELLADMSDESRIITRSLTELKSKYPNMSQIEILYLALKNETDLKNLTDKISELEAAKKLKETNYMVVGTLSDLVDGASGPYRAELKNAVDELENFRTTLLNTSNDQLDAVHNLIIDTVKNEPSFSQKTKDFFTDSINKIVENIKGTNYLDDSTSMISDLQRDYGISDDVVPADVINTVGASLDGAIKRYVQTRNIKGKVDDIVKEIRSKIIQKLGEKLKRELGYDEQKLIEKAEEEFESPDFLESLKQKMVENADKNLVPVYTLSDWTYYINFIKGADPKTGKFKGETLGKKILYWYWNTTKYAALIALAEVIHSASTDPEQLEGKEGDIVDRLLDRIGGWGPILMGVTPLGLGRILNWWYSLTDYDTLLVYPAQMVTYLKDNKNIVVLPGDLQITPEPSEYTDTTYEKETVALVSNKVTGEKYGLFTFDDNSNKVIEVQTVADSNSTSSTTGYEPKLESFKKWLTDKGKTESGPKGPDQYGVFQNGVVDYEFKDSKTGFDVTDKVYQQQ